MLYHFLGRLPFPEKDGMRSRLLIIVAAVIAAAAVTSAVSPFVWSPHNATTHAPLPMNQASYLGVYEHGALQSYQPIADFAKAAGQQPNLVGYYSGWGEPFETSFAETVSRHGAITILQWDPTLASVSEDRHWWLRQLPAVVCGQRPQVRPPGGHRLRA